MSLYYQFFLAFRFCPPFFLISFVFVFLNKAINSSSIFDATQLSEVICYCSACPQPFPPVAVAPGLLERKAGWDDVIADISGMPEPRAVLPRVGMRAPRPFYCTPLIWQEAEMPQAPSYAERIQ